MAALKESILRLINRRRYYKETFESTESGKMVLSDIYSFCGVNRQIHVPNDPYGTAFNAGMHRVVQRISSILNQSDEDINKISKLLNNEGKPTTWKTR